MSRSIAKTYRFFNVDSSAKRLANKRVRRTKDVPNGSAYKKLFESWDICDDSPHLIESTDDPALRRK